jgi:hypothetical protein
MVDEGAHVKLGTTFDEGNLGFTDDDRADGHEDGFGSTAGRREYLCPVRPC